MGVNEALRLAASSDPAPLGSFAPPGVPCGLARPSESPLFDFSSLDAFAKAFIPAPSTGLDAEATCSAAYTQRLRVLELQQSFAKAHLDQVAVLP